MEEEEENSSADHAESYVDREQQEDMTMEEGYGPECYNLSQHLHHNLLDLK